MDPTCAGPAPGTSGLPRRRGDGPGAEQVVGLHDQAPPQARGWTRKQPVSPAGETGSPAGAGMDPYQAIRRYLFAWLPRRRGDGPDDKPMGKARKRAPPQARGWTLVEAALGAALEGSPAGAGMDPPAT